MVAVSKPAIANALLLVYQVLASPLADNSPEGDFQPALFRHIEPANHADAADSAGTVQGQDALGQSRRSAFRRIRARSYTKQRIPVSGPMFAFMDISQPAAPRDGIHRPVPIYPGSASANQSMAAGDMLDDDGLGISAGPRCSTMQSSPLQAPEASASQSGRYSTILRNIVSETLYLLGYNLASLTQYSNIWRLLVPIVDHFNATIESALLQQTTTCDSLALIYKSAGDAVAEVHSRNPLQNEIYALASKEVRNIVNRITVFQTSQMLDESAQVLDVLRRLYATVFIVNLNLLLRELGRGNLDTNAVEGILTENIGAWTGFASELGATEPSRAIGSRVKVFMKHEAQARLLLQALLRHGNTAATDAEICGRHLQSFRDAIQKFENYASNYSTAKREITWICHQLIVDYLSPGSASILLPIACLEKMLETCAHEDIVRQLGSVFDSIRKMNESLQSLKTSMQ